MPKIRIVAEIDDDIFDELCSYSNARVNILYDEDADDISMEASNITINE